MEQTSTETTAKLLALHDAVWQLGNTLRDCKSRMETIQEHDKIDLSREIAQANHTLEKYSKGAKFYKPHPFNWPYDKYVMRDGMADLPPTKDEIKVGS